MISDCIKTCCHAIYMADVAGGCFDEPRRIMCSALIDRYTFFFVEQAAEPIVLQKPDFQKLSMSNCEFDAFLHNKQAIPIDTS